MSEPSLFTFLVILSTATPLFVGVNLLLFPGQPASIGSFALWALVCAILVLAISDISRWDFFGIWVRWLTWAVLAAFVFVRWQFVGSWASAALPTSNVIAASLACAVFAGALLVLIHRPPAGAVLDIHMPLADSRWYVAHGGTSVLTNHHHPVPAQRFAVDMTVIDLNGRRARGLRPKNLSEYFAFGQPVTSPCNGLVVAVENKHLDKSIGDPDASHPAGNHVAIRCGDVTLILAHLQAGSIAVQINDRVRKGQLVGRVGNSGNSSEPHLHVHAVQGQSLQLDDLLFRSNGAPLTFDGRFLQRGDFAR